MAFDDYGTGYASLSMLTEYPLTRLKIDRAFVARMATSIGDAVIVKAIVSLGLGFGLKLVAEGIETEEQAAALRRLGCHEGQGYLHGRLCPSMNSYRSSTKTRAAPDQRGLCPRHSNLRPEGLPGWLR
jgi:EAL domain-containing protein (putative c-di-GMP-specific phosphodiesterase class I)